MITETIHLIQLDDNACLNVVMLKHHLPKPTEPPKLTSIHTEKHNHTKHTPYCIYPNSYLTFVTNHC